MRRIAQHKRIRIGTVGHGYGRLRLRQAAAAVGPDWSFWIPVLGIALFVSPLLGSAVASSFPEIGPRPLTVKEAFAAVTPLKLQLDPIAPPASARIPGAAALAAGDIPGDGDQAALADGASDFASGPGALPVSSPVATATALTTALPYALDEREAADEAADERLIGSVPPAVKSTLVAGWRLAAVHEAYAKLGTRYRWGGEQPGGFDCSGFVQYVMRKQGITLPRTAREMRYATRAIGSHELQPGDLVFFQNPDHVGIYIGDKMFVHASSGRGQVTISTLDGGYYQRRYIGSGRAAE